MEHIMIDLETLGILPTAPILQIAACYFDPETGKIGKCFDHVLDWQTNGYGTIERETIAWWLIQNKSAGAPLVNRITTPIKWIGAELNEFVKIEGSAKYIWCTAPLTDLGCIKNLYNAYDWKLPWNHRMYRDARTMIDLARRLDCPKPKVNGIKHTGMYDCKWAVAGVSAAWQRIFPEGTEYLGETT